MSDPRFWTDPRIHATAHGIPAMVVPRDKSTTRDLGPVASQENPQSRTWRLSPDLLGVVNQKGVFVETNPAWQAVLGWSEAEIRQMVFVDFLHPDDIERTLAIFQQMKRGDPALHFENRYRCKDGSYRWLSWVAVSENEFFTCSARDITADKERARMLQSVEDAALLREQFLAILGHDLRTPLAAIAYAVHIAGRQPHTEKTAKMLATIEASAERMGKLIDVTTDFTCARLGEGLPVTLSPHDDLKEEFEQIVDEIRLAHPDRDIRLAYDFHGLVNADPARLGQLLSNLVANAILHGAEARPVDVRIGEADGKFAMSVTNTGDPIPETALPRLFEPFVRADGSGPIEGLGLGLYIAAQIAKAHEGELKVTSDPTETTFVLEVPLTLPTETTKQIFATR